MKNLVYIILLIGLISSCKREHPNQVSNKVVELQSIDASQMLLDSSYFKTKVYVPIYSEIYEHTRFEKTLLTATLSIRNTSEKDSLFVKRVDYYNTKGNFVRKYLNNAVFLRPLETLEYVVEERDTLGGSGANFIVEYRAKENVAPLIQSVMVGGMANRSFAFIGEGVIVKE